MKKFIIILFILLIPAFCFSEDLVTVSTKSTGQTLTAAEFNQLLNAVKDGTKSVLTESLRITTLTSAPSVPVASTIYKADGSTWDPASLSISKAYYVIYDGSAYQPLWDEDGLYHGNNSLPDPSGNGSKFVQINSGGTGYEAVSGVNMPWSETFAISDPADSDDGLWFRATAALTVSAVNAIVDPVDSSESISVDVQECNSDGDSCSSILSSAITAANTNTSGTVSDTSIASGAWIKIVLGAPSGTISRLNITMNGTR